jgi:hypothetical protein
VTRLAYSLTCCAVLLLAGTAAGRHEVLTDLEIDKLRDTAMEPDLRLKLYIEFARDRLATLEKVRSDPKVADRAQETHDRLQDFLDLFDEFGENIDNYADRKADLRKVLKLIIEADTEFQAKLRALKDSSDAAKDEARRYEFVLSDALDAVDSGVEDHRKLLAEQEVDAKNHKLAKPEPSYSDPRPKGDPRRGR